MVTITSNNDFTLSKKMNNEQQEKSRKARAQCEDFMILSPQGDFDELPNGEDFQLTVYRPPQADFLAEFEEKESEPIRLPAASIARNARVAFEHLPSNWKRPEWSRPPFVAASPLNDFRAHFKHAEKNVKSVVGSGNYKSANYWTKFAEDLVITYRISKQSLDHFKSINPDLESWSFDDVKTIFSLPLVNFIKLRLGDRSLIFATSTTIVMLVDSYLASSIEMLHSAFCVDHSNNEPQSMGNKVRAAQVALDGINMVRTSPFVVAMKKLMAFATYCALQYDVDVPVQLQTYLEIEKDMDFTSSTEDGLMMALESVLVVLQKCFMSYEKGSIASLFEYGGSVDGFFDRADKILEEVTYMHNQDVYEQIFGEPFIETNTLGRLNDIIEQGETLGKISSQFPYAIKKKFRSTVGLLLEAKGNIFTTRFNQQDRQVPFGILMVGDSCIGKSTVKDVIYAHYCSINGLDSDVSNRFTRNPASNFWDNFRSHMHTIVFDDLATVKVMGQPDETMMDLIRVMNAVAFVPDQAAIEDKGKHRMAPKLVIGTTNIPDLDAPASVNTPGAVQRRFDIHIEVFVKPQFREIGSHALCSQSLADYQRREGTKGYPDWWTFRVYRAIPQTGHMVGHNAANEVVEFEGSKLDNCSLRELLRYINYRSDLHNRTNKSISETRDRIMNAKLCKCCRLDENMCRQGGHTPPPVPPEQVQIRSKLKAQAELCVHNPKAVGFPLEEVTIVAFSSVVLYIIGSYIFTVYIKDGLVLLSTKKGRHHLKMCYDYYMFDVNTVRGFRARWYFYSRQLGREFTSLKWVPAAIGVVTGLIVAKKGYDYFAAPTVTTRSRQADRGRAPVPHDKERPDIWNTQYFHLSSADLNRRITSMKGLPFETIVSLVSRNMVRLVITGDEKLSKTGGFYVSSHIMVFNTHAIANLGDEMIFKDVGDVTDQVSQTRSWRVHRSQIIFQPKSDLAFLEVKNTPPKKDLSYLFIDKILQRQSGVFMTKRLGALQVHACTDIRGSHNTKFDQLDGLLTSAYRGKIPVNPEQGDCGSILLINSPMGPVIAGIHTAGGDGTVDISAISSDVVEAMKVRVVSHVSQGYIRLVSPGGEEMDLSQLHHKSVFHFLEDGVGEVYGALPGGVATSKSSVADTPMCKFFQDRGIVKRCAPPVMRGYKPWYIAASDMVNPVDNFSEVLVEKARSSFLSDILKDLPEGWKDDLHPYDDATTLNGAPGVAYVNSINRSSSAGFPHNRSKKFFLEPMEDKSVHQDGVRLTKEMQMEVDDLMDIYSRGERAHTIAIASLKDEPVSLKKSISGKTRVFAVCPLALTVVARKFYLCTIRLMQNNQQVFESAVGIVAQSNQWRKMMEYLVQHGEDQIVAGDYASFDKRMSPVFSGAAFEILIDLCRETGNFTDEDILIMECVKEDIIYPLMAYHGDLVQFYGSNPSGHPLTVVINSLVNSIYLRYAYLELNPEKECTDFKTNVKLMTYGDDNIMGVSPDIPWFNHTTISKTLADIGVTMTMANKEQESIPYISIHDAKLGASFLKRSFVFHEELQEYTCQLDFSSLEKTLTTWVRSKSISESEQVKACFESVHWELYFHGTPVMEKFETWFKEYWIRNHQVEGIDGPLNPISFPTADDYRVRYHDLSDRVAGLME
jgi:hypothetical protein